MSICVVLFPHTTPVLPSGGPCPLSRPLSSPPEVARTRLREEGTKYRRFFQTLCLVWAEEGYRGLYRGLGTQLVRQIPNTAIMMSTYEAVVYLLR